MSYAVVRGQAHPSQLYLDEVLDEILQAKGITQDVNERSKINLAQILYHCLMKHPTDIFMINGATGERITNEQLLKRSVPLARSLISRGAKGKNVLMVMRNHQQATAMYFALIFAGVIPLLIDPNSTVHEMVHFLKLIEPVFVFCDEEHRDNVVKSLQNCPELTTDVVVAEQDEQLHQFTSGHSSDLDSFQVSDASLDSTVMYLPTSGSTGMPKATLMSQRGLVVQLPIPWLYHSQFPRPTDLVMVLTTIQWMTFTMMLTSCVVYHIPILISPKKLTEDHVTEMLHKFRPTWTFFGPALASSLAPSLTAEHLVSLKTLILLGAPTTPELMATLQEKLPKSSHLCDGFGTTETQGFIALPDRDAPVKCNGRVVNILNYKLLDDNGTEVGLCQKGELYLKGVSTIKSYYKDEKSYNETFSNGWYKTGDVFYIDENERLSFVVRKKFSFKYKGNHVAPEEVEGVINSVPGVQDSVVCGTEEGPAAAVALRPGCDVTREQIRHAVDSSLSEHKRLHGGVAFVESLPRTHSGKLQRAECCKLIIKLVKNGQCF